MAADLAIVGAGAIGSFLAGVAMRAGHAVTMIVRRPVQRDRLRREGLSIVMPDLDWRVRPETALAGEIARDRCFDGVLLAVKAAATGEALRPLLAPHGEGGGVVGCQNGLTDDRVAALAGADRCAGVVLLLPCVQETDTAVRCLVARPAVKIGPAERGATRAAERAVGFLGPPLTILPVADIRPARWSKLAVNCASGPLLALTGLSLGALVERAEARRAMAAIVAEVMATARCEGVDPAPVWGVPAGHWLRGQDSRTEEAIVAAGRANPDARSSMSADFAAGRRSEIDWLNGAVVERAIRHGMTAPVNAAVWTLVSRADTGDRPDPATVWECLNRATAQEDDVR
ncbi:MAG: 2-dehydropantoate 2-reductase [Azospirillaceae bacterium]